MRAPRFGRELLSAELQVNVLQDMVSRLFGSAYLSGSAKMRHDTGYFQYENEAGSLVWRRLAAYIIRKAGWQLRLPLELVGGESQEFALLVLANGAWQELTPIGTSTDGPLTIYHYDLTGVPVSDFDYRLAVDTPDEHYPRVYAPYEYPVDYAPIPLLDFLPGDHPSIDDWNDVSDEVNALSEMIVSGHAFIAAAVEGTANRKYSLSHYSNNLLWAINIYWPYYVNDFVDPSNNVLTTSSIELLLNGQRIGHTGVLILAHQIGDPPPPIDIEVLHSGGFHSGDQIVSGDTVITIGAVDGNILRNCTWTGSLVAQQYDRLFGYMNNIPDHIIPPPGFNASQWQKTISITSFGFVDGESYFVDVAVENYQHEGAGEVRCDVGAVSEIQRSDDPVTWSAMQRWQHGDLVPGSGDKALNNIIQNIRHLQGYRLRQNSGERLRSVHLHYTIRHHWYMLAYIAYGDGDPELMYWLDGEWVSYKLKSSGDDLIWHFLDIAKTIPALLPHQFYIVKGVDWALEIPSYG